MLLMGFLMPREIEFRVFDKDLGKVIGYEFFNSIINDGFHYIDLRDLEEGMDVGDLVCHSNYSENPMLRGKGVSPLVRDELIGEFGSSKTKVYENDIISFNAVVKDRDVSGTTVARIENGCALPFYEAFGGSSGFLYYSEINIDSIKVVGNIYLNPELITESSVRYLECL